MPIRARVKRRTDPHRSAGSRIVHPYLFALYPVVYLYSKNVDQVSFFATLVPALILLVSALTLVRAGMIFLSREAAAVLASTLLVWFFAYSSVRELVIYRFEIGGVELWRHRYLLVIWVAMLGAFLLIAARSRLRAIDATRFLNVLGLLCFVGPSVSIASQLISDTRGHTQVMAPASIEAAVPGQGRSYPDIYYIILDAYAGSPGLREYLEFDNGEFLGWLHDRGFYVAERSHSNYSWTGLSLASSLNMNYLPADPKDVNGTYRLENGPSLYGTITRNGITHTLESYGYTYFDLSIWDMTARFSSSDFNLHLLKMTPLDRPLVENHLEATIKRHSITRKFDELVEIAPLAGPKFVYAHFLIPHVPYVFDRNGDMPSILSVLGRITRAGERELYTEQLLYTNKQVRKAIESILQSSTRDPVIILQGDHGAENLGHDVVGHRRFRMSILNAYRVPSECQDALYDSVSPVNSFRILLNCLFGTEHELLPDRAFFSTEATPHDLEDVTELVR